MSTTREQILDALTEHPDGLTMKELVPQCTACECDRQIVGRTIAQLRAERLVRPGTQLRAGEAIWMLGSEVEERVNEPALSLHCGTTPKSEKPIGGLRKYQEPPPPRRFRGADSMRMKIEAALREHGPMTIERLREHVEGYGISSKITHYVSVGILVKLGGKRRHYVYGLPGQKINGSVVASTPAPAEPQRPNRAAALATLRDLRTTLIASIAKVDKALGELA